MSKKEYTIRDYNPGDEEEIVELLQLGFDGWPHFDIACSPLEHWRWKYQENPIGRSLINIAECERRIIGARQSYLQRICIGHKVFRSMYAGDLVVHPDYRRMGI